MKSHKPRKIRKALFTAPAHIRSKVTRAMLSDALREKHQRHAARIRKGDTVKVMRGEYKGVEGKVLSVNTHTSRLTIEGITREKIRGGTVPVKVHSSKVMVTVLSLEDKLRKERFKAKEEAESG